MAQALRERGPGAPVPPELLDTLPSLQPLNIGPRELKAPRYGLAYAAPGYWHEDPLKSQLVGLSDWCQEKVHFSRRKKPVQQITYGGIEQNVFQLLGFCYTYGKASTFACFCSLTLASLAGHLHLHSHQLLTARWAAVSWPACLHNSQCLPGPPPPHLPADSRLRRAFPFDHQR